MDTVMPLTRILTLAPVGLPVLVMGVLVFLIHDQAMEWNEELFPLFLATAALFPLVLQTGHGGSRVFGLLLTSAAVLVSQVPIEAYLVEPGLTGVILTLLWRALLWSFPFLFVHFALTFPVHNEWIGARPAIVKFLYAPLGLLLIISDSRAFEQIADTIVLFLFLFGFIAGVAVFLRQYLYSLTRAEKNRLRLVTVGCVVGGLPHLVYLLSSSRLPVFTGQLALFLTPLFPVCLTLAVMKANMSEVGRWFEWLLTGSIVAGTAFFIFATLALFLPDPLEGSWGLGLLFPISLLVALPVIHILRSYFANHFVFIARRVTAKRSIDFQPIRPNPFIVGNPVRTPAMFFGREAEFQFIRGTLRSQPGGCVVVLAGERRTGKTSILYQIMRGRLGAEYAPVFLDMQGVVADNDQEFLNAIGAEIQKTIPGSQPFRSFVEQEAPFPAFSSFIEAINTNSPGRRLTFLVDEYELIEHRIEGGKLSSEIPRYLNSLIERIPGLTYVLTGSRPFDPESIWSELVGKSFYREISFLQRGDAEDLIRKPLEGRVQFSRNTVTELIRLSHGHPFYTQLLCQNLVDAVNEAGTSVVDSRCVKESMDRVIEHPPPQLLYLWGTLSKAQKLALAGLASLLRTPRAYAASDRVHRVLKSLPEVHAGGIGAASARMALEGLRQSHMLDRDQTRYRFTMDLIRLWVQADHTVWSVLAEK